MARRVANFDTDPLDEWLAHEGKLSNDLAGRRRLRRAGRRWRPLLAWSKAVNAARLPRLCKAYRRFRR